MSKEYSLRRIQANLDPSLIGFGMIFLGEEGLNKVISQLYDIRDEISLGLSRDGCSFDVFTRGSSIFSVSNLVKNKEFKKNLEVSIFDIADFYRRKDIDFFNERMEEIKDYRIVGFLVGRGFIDEADAFQKTSFTRNDLMAIEFQSFAKQRAALRKESAVSIAC
ncbi:hypothetical protein F3I62_18980 [Pseudomonas sp. R-28-1W-6]|uniref:hypothetical protein n=1 Tax=Pseudomonas sp. R-28-1W-6 TaxID=2650101 RepID=UPI0013660B47|nr:hypothetical protein [Pseudomonas sp. R-28-1W-6]MWV14190.1 hypothetical protein [Pseudomonas sp. R-28-1W-6]